MLTSQQINIPTTPDPTLKERLLSISPTIGAITAPANSTCPALSKIFDSLFNCLVLSMDFFVFSQFFISIYDNLEFVRKST